METVSTFSEKPNLLTSCTVAILTQRTPWGGGKKRGEENLTNDTPPKKGFWTPPPRTVRFPPPSGVSALFFLYNNPRQSRPDALLEGSKNFRESAFSGTFSSPHAFCTPHITAQLTVFWTDVRGSNHKSRDLKARFELPGTAEIPAIWVPRF